MKKEMISALFKKFEKAAYEYDGLEHWSARELQKILGYQEWRNFKKIISRAILACRAIDEKQEDHFVSLNRTIGLGKGGKREIDDVALTRYACYLIAQNGDPVKPEIAFAQTYFAVQTRKQELIEERLLDIERVNAREKLSKSEKKLSKIIFERGVDHFSFSKIRSQGDKALFGGQSTRTMKGKLGIPANRALADFLPTLLIKAKDFATELTGHNVVDKELSGDRQIADEHIDNNQAVRKMLLDRGVVPESLPAAEDVKKVARKIKSSEKQIIKDLKSGKLRRKKTG